MESLKQFGILPLVDPGEGTTVIEPPGAGAGYWVGGCSANFGPEGGMFHLYYRTRKPISEGRGGLCSVVRSADGVNFEWQGEVLPPGDSWDSKLTRVDTMAYVPPGFTVLYGGRSGIEETYEDRTGIAVSFDLKTFQKLTPHKPALQSVHATGSLKYSDIVVLDDAYVFYYECARVDGAHEIRMNRVPKK